MKKLSHRWAGSPTHFSRFEHLHILLLFLFQIEGIKLNRNILTEKTPTAVPFFYGTMVLSFRCGENEKKGEKLIFKSYCHSYIFAEKKIG